MNIKRASVSTHPMTMETSCPEMPELKNMVSVATEKGNMASADVKFLRKMNVMNNNNHRCRIEDFINIERKKRTREEEDEYECKKFAWKCETCNCDLFYNRKDAQRVCPTCGKTVFFQEMTKMDMISQGYSPASAYLYKRHNHFRTWLKRTQGKETTTIPPEIIDQVKAELRKERVTKFDHVSHIKVKEILKKLGLNKYYNHCVQITSIITKKKPPQMTPEQEDSLLQMFDRVQTPFETFIMGKERQNMLSYSFLIHKFLEIMSWDEYLPYFPLLVSADKIQVQDQIWKRLCKEVNFQYIRSTM